MKRGRSDASIERVTGEIMRGTPLLSARHSLLLSFKTGEPLPHCCSRPASSKGLCASARQFAQCFAGENLVCENLFLGSDTARWVLKLEIAQTIARWRNHFVI